VPNKNWTTNNTKFTLHIESIRETIRKALFFFLDHLPYSQLLEGGLATDPPPQSIIDYLQYVHIRLDHLRSSGRHNITTLGRFLVPNPRDIRISVPDNLCVGITGLSRNSEVSRHFWFLDFSLRLFVLRWSLPKPHLRIQKLLRRVQYYPEIQTTDWDSHLVWSDWNGIWCDVIADRDLVNFCQTHDVSKFTKFIGQSLDLVARSINLWA
jgi:hypothetical protein